MSEDVLVKKEDSKKPLKTYFAKGVKVTIWQNQNKEGEPFRNYAVEKVWKQGDEWKTSSSFNENDVPSLAATLLQAWQETVLVKK